MGNEVEEIKARLNIVELVGQYVKLQKAGVSWKACCPFHHEKTPSFNVNEERQMWYCFGCQKGGDAFTFLMEMEGVDFKEALKALAERTGVELSRREKNFSQASNRSLPILELAAKFYEKQLWDGVGRKKILPYLLARGLSEESIKTFRLGYAPDGWRHLLEFLTHKGYTPKELEATGLVIRKSSDGSQAGSSKLEAQSYYDRFRERIMFPIMDVLDRVIGFSGRVSPGADETQAKYINTPETNVYHKSRALYGISLAKQAMKQADAALIVEGNVDVIALHQAGFVHTVAVSGTALTSEQLQLLGRYTRNLHLFFDMDGAGQQAARRSTLAALAAGRNVAIVAISGGKDAAELAQSDKEALQTALRQPVPAPAYFLEAILKRQPLDTPEGRRQAVEEFGSLLAAMTDTILRAHWTKRLAEAVGLEERIVSEAVERQAASMSVATPSAHATTGEKQSPMAPTQSAQWSKRSEVVRDKLLTLAVLDAAVWRRLVSTPSSFSPLLAAHPLYPLLTQYGAAVEYRLDLLLNTLTDASQRAQVTQAFFAGEHWLEQEGIASLKPEERAQYLQSMAERYERELAKEYQREGRQALEKAIRGASEKGDKQSAEKLLQELQSLVSASGE